MLFGLALSPFFIFLGAIYVSTRPELRMFTRMVKMLQDEALFFKEFATNGFTFFMLIILILSFGAELISGDIRFKSFPLYFSRPLDRKDYLFGKFSIIMFYFLLFTLVPGILLYIFKFIFTGKLSIQPFTILGIIFVPLLCTFYIAAITLLLSSFSSNSKYVKIMMFLIYFISDAIANILFQIFKTDYFHILSMKSLIQQVGSFLFNTNPQYDYPAWLSLAVIALTSLGACTLLYKRIGKLEAQIESGN